MKKIILIGLLISVLVVSACSQPTGPDTTQTYIGGNEGVMVAFSSNAPPERVSDSGGEESFDIIIELENKGENLVDMNDAFISITGFPPDAFGVSAGELTDINPEEDLTPRIKTADGAIIEPPIIYATIPDLQYAYNEPGNVQYPIRANVCYLYETNVASKLCIKENMNQDEEGDLCAINSLRDISSSGAPIQVTKIQQSGAGKDKTRFTFTVENKGTGEVFKDGYHCESLNAYEDRVKVTIENLVGGSRNVADSVSCVGLQGSNTGNEGYITLTEGRSRDVSCTVTITDRTDQLLPFNIKLGYDYEEIIDTTILVEYTPVE